MSPDRRSGIVLSGGAAYGAYEVGILTALVSGASPATNYTPFNPGVISGTSSGAFNASAFLSAARDGALPAVFELQRIWLRDIADSSTHPAGGVVRFRGDPRELFDLTRDPGGVLSMYLSDLGALMLGGLQLTERFLISSDSLTRRIMEFIDLRLFLSLDPFIQLVHQAIRPDVIQASDRELRIVATDWQNGSARIFGNADMIAEQGYAAVLASASVPGIFNPAIVAGKPFVDGGVVMNTPLKPAIDTGADEIHVVSVNPSVSSTPTRAFDGSIGAIYRTLAIALQNEIRSDVQLAQRINAGIRLAGQPPATTEASKSAVIAAGSTTLRASPAPYRPVTIHRYEMVNDDSNFLGFFDFRRQRLENMIQQGIQDAVTHDCAKSQCVIPQ